MNISNINEMQNYLYQHSGFNQSTVDNEIEALGYSDGSEDDFSELSSQFENCAEHGAAVGFSGFIYYYETIAFFKANRRDIIKHMENAAAEFGTDIISMVQNFGVFHKSEKPTASEIGQALWDSNSEEDFTTLYNVFAWYALEEVSRTWYMFLEEHPSIWAALTA